MSNLLSIHNSKNQVGIGTNSINVSSDLTIKENTRRYIVCNTNNNSLAVHRTIELEDETTLSTVKTHNISSPKLLYIASNNIISSLSFSSSANTYLRVSITGGLSLVDKTRPFVVSFIFYNSTVIKNMTTQVTLQFSEAVQQFSTDNISETGGTLSSMTSSDNITWTGVFSPSSNYEGIGKLELDDQYTDEEGNSGLSTSTINYTIDTIQPDATITYINKNTSNTHNSPYKNGDEIYITATFSESVKDSPVPQISISGVNTVSNSNMDKISSTVYRYLFITSTGNGTNTISLSAQDMSGNSLASNITNSTFTIDNENPTIESVYSTTPSGSYGIGNNINITIKFTEAVTLSGSGAYLTVTLNNNKTISISGFSNSTTVTGTYTVAEDDPTVSNLIVSSIVLSSGTLQDNAGNSLNNLNIPSNITNGSSAKNINIDASPPVLSSITSTTSNGTYGVGASITIKLNFNEAVTLSSGENDKIEVTLETGSTDRSITISNLTSSNYATETYTVQNGDSTSDLTVKSIALTGTLQDSVGNTTSSISIPSNNLANSSISIPIWLSLDHNNTGNKKISWDSNDAPDGASYTATDPNFSSPVITWSSSNFGDAYGQWKTVSSTSTGNNWADYSNYILLDFNIKRRTGTSGVYETLFWYGSVVHDYCPHIWIYLRDNDLWITNNCNQYTSHMQTGVANNYTTPTNSGPPEGRGGVKVLNPFSSTTTTYNVKILHQLGTKSGYTTGTGSYTQGYNSYSASPREVYCYIDNKLKGKTNNYRIAGWYGENHTNLFPNNGQHFFRIGRAYEWPDGAMKRCDITINDIYLTKFNSTHNFSNVAENSDFIIST